ncbi:GNAT family N-acetyltransferase [Natrialbaceae archaeon A-gly3]
MSQQATTPTRAGHDTESDDVDADTDADAVRTVSDASSDLDVHVLETIQAAERRRWNDVVERADLGTVFHRYEWLEAVEEGLDYPARHLLVEKDTNPIGVFPHLVVDVPKTPFQRVTSIYPGFGGPLLTTDVTDSLPAAIDAASDLCSGRTVVHEIRACNTNFLRYNDFLKSRGYRPVQNGGRFVLRLDRDYEEILAGMDSSKRRAIRRGRETDHEIVEEELTEANLRRFQETHERHMNSVGGDVYPPAFFEALAGMDDRILLVTLRVEGEYAGGFLELLDEGRSTVHGFFAAIPEEYFEYHASELLYDYVFQWCLEEGYETYDFGGAGGDFEDGAFRFKEEFGGELVPNLYWERGSGLAWKLFENGRSLYWRYAD